MQKVSVWNHLHTELILNFLDFQTFLAYTEKEVVVIVRCNRATEMVKRVSVTGVHDIGSQGKFSRSVMSLVRRKYEPCATVKQD